MAIEYNVNRGICADSTNISDEKRNDFKLCNLLTKWQANWPIGLTDRARRCCDFAKQGIEENVFSKKQFSAVTKFMWFLEPSEWTVFDKYAAIGLGVKGITLELKMLAFYRKLEDKNFVGLCSRMQTILNESVFAELPATRILDKFFMIQGDPNFAERTRSEANLFVTLLPVSLANDLKTLGIEIQRQFGNQARKLCE